MKKKLNIILFRMEFFHDCMAQMQFEGTIHWYIIYTWMLIKKIDIYIIQKRWQTPRVSRSYSGYDFVVCVFVCMNSNFSLFIHMFLFIKLLLLAIRWVASSRQWYFFPIWFLVVIFFFSVIALHRYVWSFPLHG